MLRRLVRSSWSYALLPSGGLVHRQRQYFNLREIINPLSPPERNIYSVYSRFSHVNTIWDDFGFGSSQLVTFCSTVLIEAIRVPYTLLFFSFVLLS
jgi:hypothetical protein